MLPVVFAILEIISAKWDILHLTLQLFLNPVICLQMNAGQIKYLF